MTANPVSRRWFLRDCGVGLGAMAATDLLQCSTATAASDPLTPKLPHMAGKAKNIIYLFMAGAPSHLEMFDYKPQLAKYDGTLPPPELLKGYRAAFINPNSKLLGPKFKFARHGECGAEGSLPRPSVSYVHDASVPSARSHSYAVHRSIIGGTRQRRRLLVPGDSISTKRCSRVCNKRQAAETRALAHFGDTR